MKESAWKRTIKGAGIGLLAAFASFGIIRIPILGILAFAMHSPVIALLDSSSYIYYDPLIFAYGTLIGALLGLLRPYKFQFYTVIIGIIILSIGTSLYFLKEFAETMAHF